MLLYGNLNSNKTDILIENYARLLNSGISADKILVIVQNSKMKEEFIEKTKKLLKVDSLTKFNIYSFFGLCYNFVNDYYPICEEKIKQKGAVVSPNLCGLEASRHIFKEAVDKFLFKGYNSKRNLLHQLLRRSSLIVLNALDDDEISERTKILRESFSAEIKSAVNLYKQKTLEYRAFDYLRQVGLFSFIYKNVQNNFEYVFIDDADEIPPVLFEYLKFIKKDIKEFFIAYDPLGTSRKGYLCASENNFELFLNESPVIINKNIKADSIITKIHNIESIFLDNLIRHDFIRADEMADCLIKDINRLIEGKVKPNEILVVVPDENEYLKMFLKKISAPVNFISGSEKIKDNKTVSALLSLLRLIFENENYRISSYKLRGILKTVFKTDIETSVKITQEFEADFFNKSIFEIFEKYKTDPIEKFLNLKNSLKDKSLSYALYTVSKIFVNEDYEDIKYINRLLKQLFDFEKIFKGEFSKKELINNIENTIISENPIEEDEFDKNALNVSTPQKAIDFKIKNKYLFILDSTNPNWTKQDVGPLYNAWVFQKNRIKKDFTLEDNIFLSNDKTARILRKLYLLNNGEIRMYSSHYNFLGGENFKGIKHFFENETSPDTPSFKIIPREDQKPVLDYKKGRFAVMAVAGAGKTTIMLALIMKLIEQGTKAENIFVLTYMDSAARTCKEKIKAAYPTLSELPNISTIHGLSMRILRENNNHAHIGLDVDFDIIDEIKRAKLIGEIMFNEGIETSLIKSYDKAISGFKNSKNKNENSLSPSFKRVYQKYQKALRELNLIDYDDLLILSLELLKSNSKIREYYQNLAHYVIEDEAQDSSEIQQELINIISRKKGNLIRLGDVNQAITSTFTNSDVSGFKKFIENNGNCKMNYTARNSTGIIDLANNLIKKGLKLSLTSFFEIETKPVSGKNLIEPNSCFFKIFENEKQEKDFIINEIEKLFKNGENQKAGILTRTNKEAEIFAEYIKKRTKYRVITKTSLLSNNPVFCAVTGVFNFISNPMNNNLILEFAKTMIELGFYNQDNEIFDFIKNNPSPFILGLNDKFNLWWDLRYFLNLVDLPLFELAFKIGEYYFENNTKQKKNIALIASLVLKVQNAEGDFENTLDKLNDMIKRGASSIKLFEEDEKDESKENEIKILTLHKSKGDEFDFVFIPALTEKNLGFIEKEIEIKEDAKIIRKIQNLKKTDNEIKKEILDENLRLLYVGITRAKKMLYLTCASEYKYFNKLKKYTPSYCFEFLRSEV